MKKLNRYELSVLRYIAQNERTGLKNVYAKFSGVMRVDRFLNALDRLDSRGFITLKMTDQRGWYYTHSEAAQKVLEEVGGVR